MKKFLMMLGGICSLFIFAGCSESPMDAVEEWSNAIILGDEAKANEMSTEDSEFFNQVWIAYVKSDPEHLIAFKELIDKIEAGEVVIDGDRAEIKVDGKVQLVLKKVDKKWLVDLAGTEAVKENGYSPAEVVAKWGEAIIAGNKARADIYVTSGSKAVNNNFIQACNDAAAKARFEAAVAAVGEAEINGDTATVRFGESALTLKKVNGNWVIDFMATASAHAPARKDYSSPKVVLVQWGDFVAAESTSDAAQFVTEDSIVLVGIYILNLQNEEQKTEFKNKLAGISDNNIVINGNTAEVKVDDNTRFVLRKINGKWLIDLTATMDMEE
ncbi:MAG: hypothetical protein E7053_04410 [Lentisphaerae bacterium]|nr:hypothetical protein [Lentisphaerota bacterium]